MRKGRGVGVGVFGFAQDVAGATVKTSPVAKDTRSVCAHRSVSTWRVVLVLVVVLAVLAPVMF